VKATVMMPEKAGMPKASRNINDSRNIRKAE